MEEKKISIIIPCYNMEEYLSRCLDSVLEQTLDSIEIICIDDGSTDNTLHILETYCAQNNGLICKSIMNSGSGKARNLGIDLAQGKYIAFMDADDFYPNKTVLEHLYDTAIKNEAEICGGSACYFRDGVYIYDGIRKGIRFSNDGWIPKEKFPDLVGYWRFIYKKELLERNDIKFPDYLRGQDPPFLLKAVAKAGKVYCISDITYCYRKEHKKLVYNPQKATDYAKGIRDSLRIAQEEMLESVEDVMTGELYGEFSAMLYEYAPDFIEMREIIHDINVILLKNTKKNSIRLLLEGNELNNYLNQIDIEREHLLYKLKSYPRILVFGAGTIARKTLVLLKKNKIVPEAFVVSDTTKNGKEVEGIEVRCIDDYIKEREQCFIIIATYPRLHEEIRLSLQEKGFINLYFVDVEKLCLFISERGRNG